MITKATRQLTFSLSVGKTNQRNANDQLQQFLTTQWTNENTESNVEHHFKHAALYERERDSLISLTMKLKL